MGRGAITAGTIHGIADDGEFHAFGGANKSLHNLATVNPDADVGCGHATAARAAFKVLTPLASRARRSPRARCEEGQGRGFRSSHRARESRSTALSAQSEFGQPCLQTLLEALVLYCGRHDFGTCLYAKTKNLKLVMAVMGHKDVKTAMRCVGRNADISSRPAPRS